MRRLVPGIDKELRPGGVTVPLDMCSDTSAEDIEREAKGIGFQAWLEK